MPTALITGVAGQDGSYLAEFLIAKGYTVYGLIRPTTRIDFDHPCKAYQNIAQLENEKDFHPLFGDMCDPFSIKSTITTILAKEKSLDEVYNLAAQSHVKSSESIPLITWQTNAFGVALLLTTLHSISPKTRFYQASTSELYGNADAPQDEQTPCIPVSPYGQAKLYAHQAVSTFREKGMYAVGGILFNHESPRRGISFVTRKITNGLARIKLGLQDSLELGNLDAKRDWGFAGDYVKAMWLMLQQQKPKDYVIATGQTYSIHKFVEAAASALEMELEWRGEGSSTEAWWNKKQIIRINPAFYRAKEINVLQGNSSKAQTELGWKQETSFEQLVQMMARSDFEAQRTNVTNTRHTLT